MPYIGDSVRFLVNGNYVSGRVDKFEIKEVRGEQTVVEVMLYRHKMNETFEVLDENIEVIARGKIKT